MALSSVAVVLPHRTAMFELGVVTEVFGVDRTDDGVPPMDFRACSERPGEPLEMRNGMSIITPYGLADADDADLVVAPAYDYDQPASERPWEVMIDSPFLISSGSPGRSEQARKSMAGTPSSVRSTPKTSVTTPSSNIAVRWGRTTATVESAMAPLWQKICGACHCCHWWRETV